MKIQCLFIGKCSEILQYYFDGIETSYLFLEPQFFVFLKWGFGMAGYYRKKIKWG